MNKWDLQDDTIQPLNIWGQVPVQRLLSVTRQINHNSLDKNYQLTSNFRSGLNVHILFRYSIKHQSGGVSEVICAQGHTAICVLWHFSKWTIRRLPQQSHRRLRGYFRSQAINLFQSELWVGDLSNNYFLSTI